MNFSNFDVFQMKIIDKPYVSETIYYPQRIFRRLRWGKFVSGIYVIRKAAAPDELEIIRSEYFVQKNMRDDEKPVVGIFSSYEEAVSYVCDVTRSSFEKYGFPSLQKYIDEERG